MNDVVDVRLATSTDAAELARLRWDFRPDDQSLQPRRAFIAECSAWLEQNLSSGNWIAAVAETESGSLCGCIFLQRVEKVPIPGTLHRYWGYVTNSYVEAGWRNRGVGSRLLRLLLNQAQRWRLEFLIVWPSPDAISFYRRIGFEDVEHVLEGEDDAPPMVKPL